MAAVGQLASQPQFHRQIGRLFTNSDCTFNWCNSANKSLPDVSTFQRYSLTYSYSSCHLLLMRSTIFYSRNLKVSHGCPSRFLQRCVSSYDQRTFRICSQFLTLLIIAPKLLLRETRDSFCGSQELHLTIAKRCIHLVQPHSNRSTAGLRPHFFQHTRKARLP